MKRILALTSVFVIMIGVFFSSCTNENETVTPKNNSNELVDYGMEFASIHNDCLAYIHQGLSSAKTRGKISRAYEFRVKSMGWWWCCCGRFSLRLLTLMKFL